MSDSNMVDSSVDSRDHVVVVDTGVDRVVDSSVVNHYGVGLSLSLSLTLAVHVVVVEGMSVDSSDMVDTSMDSVDRVDRVDNMANSMVDQYRVGLRFSLSLTLAVHEVIVVIGMSIDSSHMVDSRNMSHMANTRVVDSRDSVVVVDRVDRVDSSYMSISMVDNTVVH